MSSHCFTTRSKGESPHARRQSLHPLGLGRKSPPVGNLLAFALQTQFVPFASIPTLFPSLCASMTQMQRNAFSPKTIETKFCEPRSISGHHRSTKGAGGPNDEVGKYTLVRNPLLFGVRVYGGCKITTARDFSCTRH